MRSIHTLSLSAFALSCASCSTPTSGMSGQGGATSADQAANAGAQTGAGGHGGTHPSSSGTAGQGGSGGSGVMCTPKSVICADPGNLETCNAAGNGFTKTPCPSPSTCSNGVCACKPGAVGCQGNQVVTCGQDSQPHLGQTCPQGTTCSAGLCNDDRCADEVSLAGTTGLSVNGWPRFRHDNRNSGTTTAVVADMPKLKWKVFVGGTNLNGPPGGLASGAVVSDKNVVFMGAGDKDGKGGLFYAFDVTGTSVYTFNGPRGYGWTTPAVRADGTAYYSTQDGTAYAVKPDGTKAWQYKFGFQDDCNPIVTKDGHVIYGSDSGSLFALDPNGTLIWKTDLQTGPGEVDSALAESCEGKILAGGKNGWFALDVVTGKTLWSVASTGGAGALMSSPTVTADGTMYGMDSGAVGYAIDKNGVVLWKHAFGAPSPAGTLGTEVLHLAGALYVVLADGYLHAFDAKTGNPLWSQPVANTAELYRHGAPVADANHRIYVASNDGNLYCFDATGTPRFKIPASGVATPSGNGFGTLAIGQDGTIYVPGNNGYLYAFH